MLLSAVSILVVAQSSSEIPEGLMNNPVLYETNRHFMKLPICNSNGISREQGTEFLYLMQTDFMI